MLLENIIRENFFTSEEIDHIRDYIVNNGFYTLDTETNYSRFDKDQTKNPNHFYTWDYNNDTHLFSVLNDRLNKLTGRNIVAVNPHLADLRTPYYVHTDYWQSNDHGRTPEYTVIIPLDTYDCHTIIFNEYISDAKHDYNCDLFSEFTKNYQGEKKLKIDTKFCADYLSHIHPNDLKCLSIETVFKWNKGSLLLFDRKKFHCSDNFLRKGLSKKIGIVIWTVSDNENAKN
jgi:hypothetical protein